MRAAFHESFTISELEVFYREVFNAQLNTEIPTDTLVNAVQGLFCWVERNGQWVRLLTNARQSRPTKQVLVIICTEVLTYLQSEAPGEPGEDPWQAVLLMRQLPFVDREGIREAVAEMDRPDGWCGLVVEGPRRVGKSYCRELLAYARARAPAWATDRLTPVTLERERDYGMTPVELARRLVLAVRRVDVAPPGRLPEQKEERWAADLAVWTAGQADLAEARVWVILDGFGHPDVPEATHDFIAVLAEEAANRSQLRLVLLGYPRTFPDHIERSVRREPLTYLTAEHLKDFFDHLDGRLGYRANPACAKAATAAERLVQLYSGLPSGDERQVEAIRQAFPGIVRDLLRQANGGKP